MVECSLPNLIDPQTLMQMLDQAWGLSGIPCRVILPPNSSAAAIYAQAPRQDDNPFHLSAADLWEHPGSPPEGELQFPGAGSGFFIPLIIQDTCVGVLEVGELAPPSNENQEASRNPEAEPAQNQALLYPERTSSNPSDLRRRMIEAYTNLGKVISAALVCGLENQKNGQALAELQRRYHGVFEGVQDGILVETHAGRILDANQSAARMHGYTRDEILNLMVSDLASPDRPLLNLLANTPASQPIETFNRRKDGSVFPVELSAQNVELEGFNYLFVVVRDITARKQAEEVAGLSQERLELALEATEAGFWDWDLSSGFTFLSPRWYTMLGYQPDELTPSIETWRRLLHPQDISRVNLILDQHLAGKRPFYEVEFRLRTKDGNWRWILSRGKVMRYDATGKPLRMTGTHIDISLRKQSETALRSSEEKFYKSFQISPDAISISRASDSVYLDVNNVFLTLCGYAREEVIGRKSTEIGVWAYPEERAEMVGTLQEKGEVLGMEASFRHKDGHIGIGLVAARIIDIDSVPCVLSIVRDITDRKQAEDLLRDAHIRLQWAYEATLLGWNKALEMRDVATRRHSDRCTELTLRLAEAAGIHNDDELTFIKYGAILHDIGKLAIPDMILNKPAQFNTEEWNIMRRHPLYAQEMLQGIDYLHPVLPLVTSHHERWDGNGYPLGLSREQIPLEARIFALVDVWDSMTTPRPYRQALSEDTARAYIAENSGLHFDPELVPLFLNLIAKP